MSKKKKIPQVVKQNLQKQNLQQQITRPIRK
jgi:hypothetical protein